MKCNELNQRLEYAIAISIELAMALQEDGKDDFSIKYGCLW